MKRLSLLAAVVFLTTTLSSCGSGSGTNQKAHIRVFNALPNALSFNVTIDNDIAKDNIVYGTETDDFTVDEGTHQIQIFVNGLLASVVDQIIAFSSEQSYQIYVLGPIDNASLLIRRDVDTGEGPASDQFAIRFANLSHQTDNYDVYIVKPDSSIAGAVPAADSLGYKTITKYFDIAQGPVQILVTTTGTKTVVLDSGPLLLNSNDSFTFNIIPQPEGGVPLLGVLVTD